MEKGGILMKDLILKIYSRLVVHARTWLLIALDSLGIKVQISTLSLLIMLSELISRWCLEVPTQTLSFLNRHQNLSQRRFLITWKQAICGWVRQLMETSSNSPTLKTTLKETRISKNLNWTPITATNMVHFIII